jgi:hypothetical protein
MEAVSVHKMILKLMLERADWSSPVLGKVQVFLYVTAVMNLLDP